MGFALLQGTVGLVAVGLDGDVAHLFAHLHLAVERDVVRAVEGTVGRDLHRGDDVARVAVHDAHGDALGLGDDLLFAEGGILAHVGIEVGFVKRERLLVIARRAARALDDHADLLRVAAHLALAGEKALHKAGLEIGVEHDFKALQIELLHRDLAAAVHGLADQVAAAAGLDEGFGVGHFLLGD